MDTLQLGKIRTAIEDYYFCNLDGTLVKFVEEDGSVEFPKVKERLILINLLGLWKKLKLE